jgi:plasmid stability protein
MASFVIDNIDEILLQRLAKLAEKDGVSVEDEHRQLLESAVSQKEWDSMNAIELLLAIPKAEPGDPPLIDRSSPFGRELDLE